MDIFLATSHIIRMQNERPYIITFASPKGGVGKSTSCLAIAGALCRLGYNVHIMDLDQTQTLGRWFENHHQSLATTVPNLSIETHPDSSLGEELMKAFHTRTGFILIDMAGAFGDPMVHAATIAHLTITPSKLSEPDIMEASKLYQRMQNLGADLGKPICHRILINEVGFILPAYQQHALKQIEDSDLKRFQNLMHNRAAYAEAMFSGEPPHYADSTRTAIAKAVEEIDLLLVEIFQALNDQHQPSVQGADHDQQHQLEEAA